MLDGLLHLGSMASLSGMVCLNLDRLGSENDIGAEIDKLRERAIEQITIDDRSVGADENPFAVGYFCEDVARRLLRDYYRSWAAWAFARFTSDPDVILFSRYDRLAYRAYEWVRYPELPLFLDGHHFRIAGYLTAFSFLLFLLQAFLDPDPASLNPSLEFAMKALLAVTYVTTIAAVAVSAWVWRKFQRVPGTLQELYRQREAPFVRENASNLTQRFTLVKDLLDTPLPQLTP